MASKGKRRLQALRSLDGLDVLKIKEEVGTAIGLWERLGGNFRAGVKKMFFYKAFRRRLVAKGVEYLRAG